MKFERDERSAARVNPVARKTYRFQVQGPNAMKVMQKVLGKAPPDLKFFNMCDMVIAGKKVRALRHGMAGQPGFELFGPSEDGDSRQGRARSRPARNSACACAAPAPTRRTRSSRAGFPRRCRRSIPATSA